jgi:hypothetical protein
VRARLVAARKHILLLDSIAEPTPLIEQEACRPRYF